MGGPAALLRRAPCVKAFCILCYGAVYLKRRQGTGLGLQQSECTQPVDDRTPVAHVPRTDRFSCPSRCNSVVFKVAVLLLLP